MSTPPPSPGNIVMWLLVLILVVVFLILVFSLADVNFNGD
jgi:hypothetical protein